MAAYGGIELVSDRGQVRFTQSGQPVDLVWPRGFQLVIDHEVTELLAPDGSVVIRAGQMRSDFAGGAGHICSVGGVVYQPSS